jgi:hypothetical protein
MRPFLDPAVDTPLTKGSGDTAKTPCFSTICRTFRSGGTRIRTGDTMIFRLVHRSGTPRDETAWAATQAVSSPCGPQRTPPDAANRRHWCGMGVVSRGWFRRSFTFSLRPCWGGSRSTAPATRRRLSGSHQELPDPAESYLARRRYSYAWPPSRFSRRSRGRFSPLRPGTLGVRAAWPPSCRPCGCGPCPRRWCPSSPRYPKW